MVTVLDESVSEWILSDGSRSFCLLVLSQQKVNNLLQQRFGRHLPYDAVQQRRGGQDSHLRPAAACRENLFRSSHDSLRSRNVNAR